MQGIILFGSYADDSSTIRSDMDICLVVGHMDVKDIFNKVLESDVTGKYDIKIFETLPIYMKAEVMEKPVHNKTKADSIDRNTGIKPTWKISTSAKYRPSAYQHPHP